MENESINIVEENIQKLRKGLQKDIKNFSDTLSQRIDSLDTSFNIDMSVYDSLCQHIIEDLYQAKLSILYDEYNATMLAIELFTFQQYQHLLLKSPWYKKVFKFQQKKLKEEAEVETAKKFKDKLKDIEQQIQSFTYENYQKKFEEQVEEKYQAVNDAINCQHASWESS